MATPLLGVRREPSRQPPTYVRFSWRIFLAVFCLWMLAAFIVTRFLGPVNSKRAMFGFVIFSSGWVLYDAQKKGVAKPLRWGMGSLLLWIVFFPWYLARRRTPQASCPLLEAELPPLLRLLLAIFLLFFLVGAVLVILNGPLR